MDYFTADEHYGHRNIIKYCKRPFANIDDMTECLISRHNEVVKDNDHVYHVGDMFWETYSYPFMVIGRLKGIHHYVTGNHEGPFRAFSTLKDSFVTYGESHLVIRQSAEPKIYLHHFAHRVWPFSHKGSWHLYGHSHGELPENHDLSFDVGVDCWDYYPVSLDEVIEKMNIKMGWQRHLERLKGDFDANSSA